MSAVEFWNVDILFYSRGKAGEEKVREALVLLDKGRTRDEILGETSVVLGVAGASLAVEKGEICVLMGLSGSGKSTLLRAVNGLNPVSRGKVLVEHEGRQVDIAACDGATLRAMRTRRIAMVFQQFALLPWRSVRDNVGFGLELRGVPAAARARIVDEKLELVGLSKWADRYTSSLSGGMQQRVGLARAFATDADILLMDEPFSALDPLIREKLQDELLELQARLHKTIIFVSHDLDEALKIGNRIAIMEGGRIVQSGAPEEILLTPANDYVAEFVKHMNPLKVLRGTSVMTPAAELARADGAVLLDAGGRLRVAVDGEGRPIGVTFDGRAGRLAAANGASGTLVEDGDVIVAPVDLHLKAAVALKHRTGHPVLLVDGSGRLAGVCGDQEIYRALCAERGGARA